MTIREGNCTADVTINSCAGACSSGSVLSEDGSSFESHCACCAPDPDQIETMTVQLVCGELLA